MAFGELRGPQQPDTTFCAHGYFPERRHCTSSVFANAVGNRDEGGARPQSPPSTPEQTALTRRRRVQGASAGLELGQEGRLDVLAAGHVGDTAAGGHGRCGAPRHWGASVARDGPGRLWGQAKSHSGVVEWGLSLEPPLGRVRTGMGEGSPGPDPYTPTLGAPARAPSDCTPLRPGWL